MSIFYQAIGFVFVSLIIINGLLGGGVLDAIGTFTTDEETEQARMDLKCLSGYLMYMPTTEVFGITVPVPSYANVVLSILITYLLIMIIEIPSRFKFSIPYSLLLLVIVWITIKMVGLYFVYTSTDICPVWATETAEKTSGIYITGGYIAAGYAVIKMYLFKK